MMGRKRLRFWVVGLLAASAIVVLAGCGGGDATEAPADAGGSESYTSAVLDTSYTDALGVSTQLVLGTIRLEQTENAVTPEQAVALLPLWQALQGGVTAPAEVNALLKQVEGTMTEAQLAAIAAMQLTRDDLQAWMEEQGLGVGGFPGADQDPDVRATRQAEFGSGEMPPEMSTRRAEFENMSDEEREAMRATAQAGGGFPGGAGAGGRGGAGGRAFGFLLNPLIELLEARAGGA